MKWSSRRTSTSSLPPLPWQSVGSSSADADSADVGPRLGVTDEVELAEDVDEEGTLTGRGEGDSQCCRSGWRRRLGELASNATADAKPERMAKLERPRAAAKASRGLRA